MGRVVLLLVIFSVLFLLFGIGSANAATYYTLNCPKIEGANLGLSASVDDSVWNPSGSLSSGVNRVSCGGYWNTTIGAASYSANVSGNFSRGSRLIAPAGTSFSDVKAYFSTTGSGSLYSHISAFSPSFVRYNEQRSMLGQEYYWTGASNGPNTWNISGQSTIDIELECYIQDWFNQGLKCSSVDEGEYSYIAAPRFKISDTTSPTTPSLSGTLFNNDYSLANFDYVSSGSGKTLLSSSTDLGGGLYKIELRVNGSVAPGAEENVCTPKNQARWDRSGNINNSVTSSDPFFPQGLAPCQEDSNYTASSPDSENVSASSLDTASAPFVEGLNTVTTRAYDYSNDEVTGTEGDGIGNASAEVSRQIVIDKTGPAVQAISCSGTQGNNGWYTSNVTCSLNGVSDLKEGVNQVSGVASSKYYGTASCTEQSPCSTSIPITTETPAGVTITGIAYDNVGNPTLNTSRPQTTIKIDKTPPAAPVVQAPGGFSSSNSAVIYMTGEEDGIFHCALDNPSFSASSPCDPTTTYSGLPEGSHTLYVWQEDEAGLVSSSPATKTWTVDTVAPSLPVIAAHEQIFNTRRPVVYFSGAESGGSFECNINNEDFLPCSNPYTTPELPEGENSIAVRQVDAAGNRGAEKSTIVKVDVTSPSVGPFLAGVQRTRELAVQYSLNFSEKVSGLQKSSISILGNARDCTKTISGGGQLYTVTLLGCSEGNVRISLSPIAVLDMAGNVLSEGATSSVVVIDRSTRKPTLASKPASKTRSRIAQFDFLSSENGVKFACSLGNAKFSQCASPIIYQNLPLGQKRFRVRAKDPLGNTATTEYLWSVVL